jgi:nucleolar protein 53
LPAVPAPHTGTSYNPPEAAHTELLRAAHEAELRRVQEAEALEAMKARILSARHADGSGGDGGAPGMLIDKPGEGVEEQEEQVDSVPADQSQGGLDALAKSTKSVPQRKTKQQRRKAEKLRAEVCGLNLPSTPLLLLKRENTSLL